jgi:cholesterol oxidase
MDHFDWVIVGSGFGGSVSALRLVERGYKVLVIEKGKRWKAEDFAESNWNVPRWMWRPEIGLKGIFQMSFMRHVTILHGVGVGGGSLVYANTLPTPKDDFFEAPSWADLADWKEELAGHYTTARRMLGSARNPTTTRGDEVLQEIAKDMGREDAFHPTDVAVYFGEAGVETPDPYFDGEGPARTGCTNCGACMTGCRVGAKNTLDKNYLYLAEKRGVEVRPETEVTWVAPNEDGGYRIDVKPTFGGAASSLRADRVVFAGGVMGTVPLLLSLKESADGLPGLSDRLGDFVRTNSEALFAVVSPDQSKDYSKGVAITSILHTDDHSHIEPVRYAEGSGFFRLLAAPHAPGSNVFSRLARTVGGFLRRPVLWFKALTVRDFARQSQILLYMRTLEGTLRMRLGRSVHTGFTRGLVTQTDESGMAPSAFIPEATELAERFAEKVGGAPMTLMTETLLGVPSTAHILGGCCMGESDQTGVIDHQHQVFGYDGLYVIDGSAVSANPGVNPSLTITALAERAMSMVPAK